MAKRKTAKSGSEKPKRKRTPPEPRTDKNSEEIRSLAGVLRELAKTIEDRADDLKVLDVPIAPQMGNWNQGMELVTGWVNKQLIPRVLGEATKSGKSLSFKISLRDNEN